MKPLFPAILTVGAVSGATFWAQQTRPTTAAPAPTQAKTLTKTKAATSKVATAPAPKPLSAADTKSYRRAIDLTRDMASDARTRASAAKFGLDVMNVTWEDTGRYKGSSVGPNISDMTIQVASRDAKTEKLSVAAMPVIRFPNFSDKTADLSPHEFTLLVGNQAGRDLRRVSLANFLENPTAFLTQPGNWKSPKKSLLAPRDSKVLVSAQACFLPIPKQGAATFNPVVFNYQSGPKNPAVLTILATREGTSTTVIDNARDAFETGATWGQRLFHNANGQRASLTGTRQSEFRPDVVGGAKTPQIGKKSGMNLVLLIQVPLKHKEPEYEMMDGAATGSAPMAAAPLSRARRKSDVENAVIGHGALEGLFTETDNLPIERDPRFPVRVTVQFYKATSNGVVSGADLKQIAAGINAIYTQSDAVGSLVTGGETGRITEYEGVKVQPAGWWNEFWKRRQSQTGWSRPEQMKRLGQLLGANYRDKPVSDLYLRDLLRRK